MTYIVAAFLLPTYCFCQKKDSIFLYNGQVLIGDIKKVNLGVLTIDDIDLNMQNVKLYKIKILKSTQEFRIETMDKKIYFSTLHTTTKYGYVNIKSNDSLISLHLTDINNMYFLGKKFSRRLDGNIGAGFSFSKSSGVGQLNLNAAASYITKKFGTQETLSSLASIDSSRLSRDNENLELYNYYELNSRWILVAYLSYQRNLELSIARRFQEMVGVGNTIVSLDHIQLVLISGIAVSQEKSTEKVESGPLFEIPAMMRLNFYKFKHPDLQISTNQAMYFSLTEKGRVRYNGTTNFSWELINDFDLNINLYSSFDSKPPIGSISKFDYGIVIGFSYKF